MNLFYYRNLKTLLTLYSEVEETDSMSIEDIITNVERVLAVYDNLLELCPKDEIQEWQSNKTKLLAYLETLRGR